ncbi:MAG: dienelactone hydrolase family protein [Fimbriiglobus sp.]
MRFVAVMVLSLAFVMPSFAQIKKEAVEYKFDGVTFKGELVYDTAKAGKRPGVLVVHEWWGLNDYAKGRAEALAKMGYVAFACDMYGDGKAVTHPEDAGKMAQTVRKNVDIWRGRAKAALEVLEKHEMVDNTKLAAMGYCFGGSTALQLAYSGSKLKAVVTFHAALPTITAEDAKKIQAKVLICHGADDSFIKEDAITKFRDALTAAKVDLDFQSYPGAVHSFTVPDADKHMIKGMAYNADADKKSWAAMSKLLETVFK